MTDFYYGAIQDTPDSRDYPFASTRMARASAPGALPAIADITWKAPPIKNQGAIGSCVAQAASSVFETIIRGLDDSSQIQLSALDLYRRARIARGSFPDDSGLEIRDALKVLTKEGIPTENQWPYNVELFNNTPPIDVNIWARQRRLYAYYRIEPPYIDGIRQTLADGYPVLFSFQIFGSFLGPRLNDQAVLQKPEPGTDSLIGGHCCMLTGYLDANTLLRVQNSWGTEWGNNGRFWMPYSYAQNHGMDCWAAIG